MKYVLTTLRNNISDEPEVFEDIDELLEEVRDLVGFNGPDEDDEIQITFKED